MIVIMEKTFTQSELEAIAAVLADTSNGLTGSEIGHILATLKMADPAPTMTKWKRLHNAFVERQNYSQNRRAILQFIREAMKPERYAKQLGRFEPMRTNLNRALAFSGDELRADLTRRGVHPDVLRFCRAELVADNYFHAVLEAAKSIADKLRAKSGLTEDGAKLVDAALCGSAPRVAINDLIGLRQYERLFKDPVLTFAAIGGVLGCTGENVRTIYQRHFADQFPERNGKERRRQACIEPFSVEQRRTVSSST